MMNSFDRLEKNISLLESRFQDFVDLSDLEKYRNFYVKQSKENVYNLFLEDNQKQFYPVYDDSDPLKGMEDIISGVRNCKGNIICILGLGLCHSVIPLVEAAGDQNTIVFFESNPVVFKKAMELYDFGDVFTKENVRVVVGKIPDFYKLLSTEKDKLYVSIEIKVIEFNKITSADKAWYETIANKISGFSIKQNNALNTVVGAGRFFFKNRFDNLLIMAEAKALESLRGGYNGKTAILVAAGPSLSKNIDQLLKVKKRVLIIAVDSAVVPLVNKGIIPDYIVTVDFRDFTYEKLAPVSALISESNLIMISEASPKIPACIRFKEIYYVTQNETVSKLFDDILGEKTIPFIDASSVFHLAMFSAQVFGCSLIVFTGLDLAYADTQDHVEGTVLNWGNTVKANSNSLYVEGVYGKPVHTLPGFIAMKEICERLIYAASDLRYIDATEGGAKVQGSEVDKLINVINGLDENDTIKPIEGIKNKRDYGLILARLESIKKKLLSLMQLIENYELHKKNIQKYFKNSNNFVALPAKLKNHLHKMDTLTTRLNDDETMAYAKELLTEYYQEYFQHEKKKMASDATKKNSLLTNLNQQIFVHKIRKKALVVFLDLVNKQIEIFKRVLEFDKDTGRPELIFEKAIWYFENDFISKSELIIEKLDNSEQNEFIRGKIRIKKGDVKEGKIIFENLIKKNDTYKEKVKSFYKDIVDEWNKIQTFESHKRILMDRILVIEPEHREAVEYKKNIQDKDLLQQSKQRLEEITKKYQSGNLNDALKLFEKNKNESIHPKLKAEWLQLHARSLFMAGDLDQGLEILNKAVEFDPKAAVIWVELGDVFFSNGDLESALIAYENCLFVMPENSEILFNIGEIYYKTGKIEAARLAYESLLFKNPEHKASIERLREINK